MMLMAMPRTWYFAGADGITSALASMAAGICLSLSTTLSELSVVGLPLMMSVTDCPENVMLPFISLTPGMLVNAS